VNGTKQLKAALTQHPHPTRRLPRRCLGLSNLLFEFSLVDWLTVRIPYILRYSPQITEPARAKITCKMSTISAKTAIPQKLSLNFIPLQPGICFRKVNVVAIT
jgi:hypothetical protein